MIERILRNREMEAAREKQQKEWDSKIAERNAQSKREQQERQQQVENERLAKLQKVENEKLLIRSWEEFLAANRAKFRQIVIIKDSVSGDYPCLMAERDALELMRGNIGAFEAKQMAEVASYPLKDTIADEFVKWLNEKNILNRYDWAYGNLKDIDTFKYGCSSPKKVWRANRNEKRID